MSLAEFIAATQVEMKSRIEEECKKQMLALLEISFSSKWEEYTSKTIEAASATPLYTKQYGKLDLVKDHEGKPTCCLEIRDRIKLQIDKISFSSKSLYFIHCCIKITFGGGGESYEAILIDNYGFHHSVATNKNGGYCYPDKPYIIDITKPVGQENYLYPLPNSLINTIRALPIIVDPAYQSDSYGNAARPGGNVQAHLNILPEIRKAAAIFHEQATATEKLLSQKKTYDATLAENEALKVRLAELEAQLQAKERRLEEAETKLRGYEASSPSEDLLGLVVETEPSRA